MEVLDKFYKVTNCDISLFLTDVYDFIQNSLSSITQYYAGYSVDKSVFVNLSNLLVESKKIEDIISINKDSLSDDTSFWDLLDDFENAKTKLETINTYGKWSRSSYVYGYDNKSKASYTLKQHQNIESVSNLIGDSDEQNDWVDIALDNQLKEIDYDVTGGNDLSVTGQSNNGSVFVNNGVVDYMIGENILGKDLNKKITFSSDDVEYLGVNDTLIQSAGICLNVSRKSVPEFPNIGYNKTIVGGNLSMILQSPIQRDIVNNFNTDLSFKEVQMTDMSTDQDTASYEFKIVSRLNNELTLTLN